MSVSRSLVLLLAGSAVLWAQEPVVPPVPPVNPTPLPVNPPTPAPTAPPSVPVNPTPGVIRPPGVPIPGVAIPPTAVPGANIPNPVPGVPLGETKITAPIEELKLNGDGLAGLYHKFTGRRVIVATAAATAEFRFIQEASPTDPLTYQEAADLLKKAAVVEGFVFVPAHDMPNVDILTNATAGVNPKEIGIPVVNETENLPEGDAVIHYVMTLNYIKPADAVNAFSSIIGQFGAYGSIAAIPNASAIVITENTSLIKKLIDLKREIDKPGSVQSTRFIKVNYADVTEIASTLTDLFTAQQSAQSTAGSQRVDGAPQGNPNLPQNQAGGGGGGGEQAPPQIIPDPRTNRIFAMGRPVDLVFVESLVREFDVETSEKNFLRRKLRFLKVSEFLPIANDALTRAFSGTGTAAAGGGGSATGSPSGTSTTTGGNRQTGGGGNSNRSATAGSSRSSSSGSSSTGSSFGSGSSGGSSSFGSGGGSGSALSDPDVSSAPESVLVGRTLLVADNITNSIVVQGPPSGLEIIQRLLDQIDVKPDQVMISTVIGQLTLTDNFNLGLSYVINGTDLKGSGGGGNPALDTPNFNPGTLASGAGLQVYGRIGNNLSVYLNTLKQKTDFTVLSRPSIFTANNQKGTISSGERIAIPTSSNSFTSGGASTNIEYQDVVLKLEVIPLVNSNQEITMQIALLNDEANGTQKIVGGGANGTDLEVPRITTREVLTTVTVPNGEAVVLGGLVIDRHTKDKSGIPILSDIPLLGALFSSRTNNKDRSELLVFMQPSIVGNDRSLQAVQADMDARYRVAEKAQTDNSGAGVLPPLEQVEPVVEAKGKNGTVRVAPGGLTVIPAPSTKRLGAPHHR